MTTTMKNALWMTIAAAAAPVMGCGSPSTSGGPVAWTCANQAVPFGSTYQCTSSDPRVLSAAAALGGSYSCTAGTLSCPPAEDAPPPSDDGGSASGDAGVGAPGADASPPAEDSPPPGDSGVPPTSGPDASLDEDAGTPSSPPPGGSGGSDAGTGHGGNPNGTPDGGMSHGGNPHNPPGGSCGCDAGVSEGPDASESSDAGESSPDAGESPDAGGPPFDCDSVEVPSSEACSQPPACDPGTHPSACGACVPNDTTEDCQPPTTGGCWVTGGGTIPDGASQDSFGGNAMSMKSGTIRGEWEDVDHGTGMQMHGEPSYLYCRQVNEPGPGADNGPHHDFTMNQAYFGGAARVNLNGAWADGYWFDVVVDDHGEGKGAKAGGPDLYHITIRKLIGANQSGAILLDDNANMSGGNIQLHPPNNGHPYVASALPTWVTLQP
jgi:hypothetical protein